MSDRGLKGVKLSDEQRLDWLQLIRSENIGPRTFRELINRYGGARGAIDALPSLARHGGAPSFRLFPRQDAERELATINIRGARLVALGEPEYPLRLQTIYDAPPLLTIRGAADVLSKPIVGIVGSRNASAAGMKFAERIARELGDAGFVIASGLARGIDAAAHRGSLTTAQSPYWLAATTASIRANTKACSRASSRPARRLRKCRSPGSRGRTTSRAATG